jgi:hypothetical protein
MVTVSVLLGMSGIMGTVSKLILVHMGLLVLLMIFPSRETVVRHLQLVIVFPIRVWNLVDLASIDFIVGYYLYFIHTYILFKNFITSQILHTRVIDFFG